MNQEHFHCWLKTGYFVVGLDSQCVTLSCVCLFALCEKNKANKHTLVYSVHWGKIYTEAVINAKQLSLGLSGALLSFLQQQSFYF